MTAGNEARKLSYIIMIHFVTFKDPIKDDLFLTDFNI